VLVTIVRRAFWVLFSVGLWATPVLGGILSLDVRDRVRDEYGEAGVKRLERWEAMVWDNTYQSTAVKLRVVNDFFNGLKFETDLKHWGQEDYWATPIETLGSNGGDCEDFAIAKYFTLRQLGVPSAQMRITYVKALKQNQPHMVLTYYPDDAEPLVLDILIPEMLPASLRPDLVPVYSFNADGLWAAKTKGEGPRLGNASDIGMWRDLQSRMGAAQFK
jgi:predicted transglutaminase-like cysteine proteinase